MATKFEIPFGYGIEQVSVGGVATWFGYKGSCRGPGRREFIVEDAGSREYVISVLVDHANGWHKPEKAESDKARAERVQQEFKRAEAAKRVKSTRDNPPLRWSAGVSGTILLVRIRGGEWVSVPTVVRR